MPRTPTTWIGVKRIVIEVNRNLTVEQLETLDDTLRRLGLVKTTKVTLHNQNQLPHKPRLPRQQKPNRLNPTTPAEGPSEIPKP